MTYYKNLKADIAKEIYRALDDLCADLDAGFPYGAECDLPTKREEQQPIRSLAQYPAGQRAI
jgi:hypothetical protein